MLGVATKKGAKPVDIGFVWYIAVTEEIGAII